MIEWYLPKVGVFHGIVSKQTLKLNNRFLQQSFSILHTTYLHNNNLKSPG